MTDQDTVAALRQQIETLTQQLTIRSVEVGTLCEAISPTLTGGVETFALLAAAHRLDSETLDQFDHDDDMHGNLRRHLASLTAAQERMTEDITRALAELRHAYVNLRDNRVSLRGQHEFADGLLAPQIRRLEKAVALSASSRETKDATTDQEKG